MKAIILVGTVGLLSAPALAGNGKKIQRDIKPVAKVVVAEAPAAAAMTAPAIELPATPVASAAAAPVAAPGDLMSPELLVLPDLPADTRSALNQFPELEHKLIATPAAKPAKAMKNAKAPQMKLGTNYVLGARKAGESAKPGREVEQIVPKGLSQAQVATVVQSHMTEIQDCWNLVPKAERADACTADLRLSISDAGVVTDIELEGVPSNAHKCMSSVISKWQFPVAETKSDVEYGISLRTLD